ncbi:hypothetical protein AVEN_110703-1 [Araneus ventricosus]|uniref:Tc1-like transposase DDE domain-containing protein n=1 Tax=Araneus ventricosus TaxID=182803 RepID=A0A4Y2AVV0_ARAVE|nr:hypothetical protein AVEN_110703-1 [Araneus ventricosus]
MLNCNASSTNFTLELNKAIELGMSTVPALWTNGRVRVWRQPHESIDPTCQQGTVQSNGASVMVWGMCSWRDMGPLIRLKTTLIAGQCGTPHGLKVATELFQEHSSDFRHFQWPPKTPDMNFIEHIYNALQRAVQKRFPPPRTPMNLLTALQDSWCELPLGYLQTLMESMLRRVVALLRAGGGPTRYQAGVAVFLAPQCILQL